MDRTGAKRLYVKFFDVDWDEQTAQPVPLAAVEIDTARLHGLDLVPTVFITNRTLVNLPVQQLDTLATILFKKIESLALEDPHEIQFDCDWTAQTQSKYFALLNSFRSVISGTPTIMDRVPIISATIRLHQLKYFKETGVPPADRGMLMCYNMGDMDDWATQNSIIDIAEAEKYFPNGMKTYPLPLDFALPLFHWGVLFRDGRMIKLLNNLQATDLQDATRFKRTAINRYEVVKSTYLRSMYLYAGDRLRLEGVSPQAMMELAKLMGPHRNDSIATVAFYSLDTIVTSLFTPTQIKEALVSF